VRRDHEHTRVRGKRQRPHRSSGVARKRAHTQCARDQGGRQECSERSSSAKPEPERRRRLASGYILVVDTIMISVDARRFTKMQASCVWNQRGGSPLLRACVIRAHRGTNSIVVSRRRSVRKPRTYLREDRLRYLSAYARSIWPRIRCPRTRTARIRTCRSPT